MNRQPAKTARTKAVGSTLDGGGIYFGVIRRVDGNQVYVELKTLAPGYAFGPCIAVGFEVMPTVNDRVICAFLNNEKSELVVLGKIFAGETGGGTTTIDGGTA